MKNELIIKQWIYTVWFIIFSLMISSLFNIPQRNIGTGFIMIVIYNIGEKILKYYNER